MEVEHGHDTASRMPIKHGVHAQFGGIDDFNESNKVPNRDAAMSHTLTSVLKL